MIHVILAVFNSLFLIASVIALLYLQMRQNKRIEKIEKELADRGEVLDHSECYRGAAIKLAYFTGNDPKSILEKLKKNFGKTVKVSMNSLDPTAPDFPERIKELDKQALNFLLDKLKELEEFEVAGIVHRELETRSKE